MKFFRSALVSLIFVLGLAGLLSLTHAITEETQTRDPLWSIPLRATAVPFVAEDRLFVPTALPDGKGAKFQALDVSSGQVLWTSEEPIQRVFAVEEGKVYGSNKNHHLTVLDASKGQTIVAFEVEIPENFAPLSSAIGVVGGAFITSINLGLESDRYEISARTSEQILWTFLTPERSQISSGFYEPNDAKLSVVREGIVLLPILVNPQTEARGYQIVALEGQTGKLLWQWETAEDSLDDVTVLDDTVYVSFAGYSDSVSGGLSWVKALDLQTGKERWMYSPDILGKAKLSRDREVFIWDKTDRDSTDSVDFVVLDRQTGQFLRKLHLAVEYNSEPRQIAIAGNTIYLSDLKIENPTVGYYATADNHSWVNAFDAITGCRMWKTPTLLHSHLYPPVVESDRAFVANRTLNEKGQNVIQAFAGN